MSNNLKDENEFNMKKTLKLVKIPLNFKRMKTENDINSNNNETKNKKLGFNTIMRNEIQIVKTESSSLENTSESFITNKNFTNRDFDFLKEKYNNTLNTFNIPFKRNNNLFTTEGKKTININNTFRIQPLHLNTKFLFNNTKIINNNINDKDNDYKLNQKSISNYFIKNPFTEKSPLKLNETFKNRFFNKNEPIINTHKKTYSTEKKNQNGYKEFLTKTTISNLPVVIPKTSNLKEEKSKKDIIQTEKEKYQKISETFIKIKCLLNLDCEPGNEREYIKNFFKKFGYNNNDITEDKISNFLNFINEEPFPIDPKKTLKENILLAMKYNKTESESDNENYDEEDNEEEKEKI